MYCEVCGVEAATKYVEFYQNIGLLVLRLSKSIKGNLCKSCIHKYFWEFTGITLAAGWWGLISFVFTPFILMNNVGRYLFCLGMPAGSQGAQAPRITRGEVERLKPFLDEIAARLMRREKIDEIAEDIGPRAGLVPRQVVLIVKKMRES